MRRVVDERGWRGCKFDGAARCKQTSAGVRRHYEFTAALRCGFNFVSVSFRFLTNHVTVMKKKKKGTVASRWLNQSASYTPQGGGVVCNLQANWLRFFFSLFFSVHYSIFLLNLISTTKALFKMEAAAPYRYPGDDVRSDRAARKVREREKNNKKNSGFRAGLH